MSPFDIDIICLQELVARREHILNDFIHHVHHTAKVNSSFLGNNIRLLHGGLATVSKWPILEEDAHVFTGKTYHAEAFMAKAVQYCKILLHETHIVHVFNTHLQAWTNPKASGIRQEQMRQIAAFITRKLCDGKMDQEPVMLLGDFNIDMYEHAEMMNGLMNLSKMRLLMPATPQFSFDPSVNPLVGTDDAAEYATRSKLNGCYEDYLQFGTCSCCPKQLVDGIALLEEQHRLVEHATVNVVPILSRAAFEMNVNISTRRMIETVSDHFAVRATFEFNLPSCGIKFKPTYHNAYHNKVHFGWVLFQLVLFLVIFLCLLSLFQLLAKARHRRRQHHQAAAK